MGARGLILVNGHFGNRDPLTLATRALTAAGLPVLQVDYPGLDGLAARINDSPPAGHGFMHADEFETSVMLAVAPDAVRMNMAAPAYPDFPPSFGAEPWQLRDISPSGVFGDPRPATAAKGQAFLEGLTAQAQGLIAQWRARHGI
jgi:creatinine amidohydrolase